MCLSYVRKAQIHIDNRPLAKGILSARAFPWRDGAAVGRPDGHWGGPKLDVAAGTPPQSHHAPSQTFAAVIFDAAWEQEAANRARGLLGGVRHILCAASEQPPDPSNDVSGQRLA